VDKYGAWETSEKAPQKVKISPALYDYSAAIL